jgi:MoaA/NifB/PqqE/SkfB family radical SAM enzyme
MRAEAYALSDSERVLAHPDTPAAYVDWREVLPLLGREDQRHTSNLVGWSRRTASEPLGASRRVFDRALRVTDGGLDEWMETLASTSIEDFVDHFVPFLRNVDAFAESRRDELVRLFLGAFRRPELDRARTINRKLGRELPDSVLIEITKSCNFACSMCSSRTGGWLAEQTMPVDVFGDIVRVLGPGARTLRINGYGETTLVPELERYLGCLDVFGVTGMREIITNLSAPLAVYEDLFARGFVLLVSWDATSAELFERLRSGAQFDRMLETLRALGRTARSAPERLVLLSTIQRENVGEIVSLVELAADMGVGLVIFNMVKEEGGSPWMEEQFDAICGEFEAAERLARSRALRLRVPDHIGRRKVNRVQTHRSSGTFCDRPWRELLVRWDTEATVCNMFNPWSYGPLVPPGRPRELQQRVERLWNGPNAAVFRAIVNEQPHPYCEGCYFLQGER